jgi:broad specificity phosphatase PhoE
MARRARAALLEIAAAHEGQHALAVTQGGPIRAAFAFAAGTSYAEARRTGPEIGNAFVVEFAVEDGALRRLD